MTLEQQIEGVLFYKAAPVKKNALEKLFDVKSDRLEETLTNLAKRLETGATRLITTQTEVELVTAPELDEMISALRKDEMRRDIGKAGAETLAIILYRGPLSRAEIDRIRGVNSAFILRNLQVRGLIEKLTSGRQTQFQPTTTLLAHLGITNRTEAPDFESVMNALDKYEQNQVAEA